MKQYPKFKAAVMHVAPVFPDTPRAVDRVCALTEEAAANGAQLIVFSETFVSVFPFWSAFNAPIYNHGWFRKLAASAVMVPEPENDRIAATARKAGAIVSIGINEGSQASVGCVWNSSILIGCDGLILNPHRGVLMILSLTGAVVAGPVQNEEKILDADIDTQACVEPKQLHDLSGYYNRFDVFKLTIDRSANEPASFEGGENSRKTRPPEEMAEVSRLYAQ